MLFRVTKQFPRGPETELQKFMKRDAAETFIQEKLREDARFKLQTIYRLYDDLDHLLAEYSANAFESPTSNHQETSAGKDSNKRFSPTPFNTAPRPGGIPPSSFRDDTETKDKK